MLDEHMSWTDHIMTVESKIVKNIGLLHRTRQVLNRAFLKTEAKLFTPYLLLFTRYSLLFFRYSLLCTRYS